MQAEAVIDDGTTWRAQYRPVTIRVATIADVEAMNALIERSARDLNQGHYTPEELAAAIDHVFGVDTRLVDDGSYYVAERDGALAGCGGWSGRRTLFGGDRFAGREDMRLDPATDAARIRAFFVAPDHARAGVATALLAASVAAAHAAGFRTLELMATLPGVAFYQAAGFVAGEPILYRAGGVDVPFLPMTRKLSDPTGTIRRPASPQADQRFGGAMS
ncbi:GNAT family N-acetyltransferase [uncultured Sphingomonas sp.]|uniref:GNAT family N-acetyltransferase n=1 Tax=uncultured Sphingomonas sp. TaxID=158754 RepID=UPI0035CB7B62